MSRRNVAGGFSGDSQRITLRVGPAELRALDELAQAWGCDRSAALRRALRDRASDLRRQRRDETLARLDSMTVPELRAAAARLHVRGRSRKTAPELRTALRELLQP